MADLGAIGTSSGDSQDLMDLEITSDEQATATAPTNRPAPQGGLVLQSPNCGGTRG